MLSTNWNDIGKEKTGVKPPDGMEWKKYDYQGTDLIGESLGPGKSENITGKILKAHSALKVLKCCSLHNLLTGDAAQKPVAGFHQQ